MNFALYRLDELSHCTTKNPSKKAKPPPRNEVLGNGSGPK